MPIRSEAVGPTLTGFLALFLLQLSLQKTLGASLLTELLVGGSHGLWFAGSALSDGSRTPDHASELCQ